MDKLVESKLNKISIMWVDLENALREEFIPTGLSLYINCKDVEDAALPQFQIGLVRMKSRDKGKIRLCYKLYSDSEEDWKPIQECTVEVKLKCTFYIHTLIDKIRSAKDGSIAILDKAISNMKICLEGFGMCEEIPVEEAKE